MHRYSSNKNYFCNYFYMGGERFEANDPNYLFGDNCDLNFLTCTKPYTIPYKKAQQTLLSNLSTKQKSTNKVSSRMGGLGPPFNILTGRHRQISQSHKQDAQTQTLNNSSQGLPSGPEPSQPLIMSIHIRKETLKIIKVANTLNDNLSAHSTTTSKSGYTSVRDVPPSDCPSDENDDCYQDALNDPTSLSLRSGYEDNGYRKDGSECDGRTKRPSDVSLSMTIDRDRSDSDKISAKSSPKLRPEYLKPDSTDGYVNKESSPDSRDRIPDHIYNIEFMFDTEVDCSIRVFYFCNRDITSNNVSYKPQHATYESKLYTYKKGLNQKFEQQEHTFQPHLFDEDLFIYKPLDSNGNYNPGAVFPIVIHCVALEGPSPKQSQSLVATVEKSQLDDSYSIKPLKQLLFVDGVQYILQDIYGIENKSLISRRETRKTSMRTKFNRALRSSNASLYSRSNLGSNTNLSDTASVGSAVEGSIGGGKTNQYMSLASENSFECVICMSDERDTMLLPCRHLCLCSSCAQSLRYQASSCPICRCPFKAALNIRVVQRDQLLQPRSWSTSEVCTEGQSGRECVASSATPLLTQNKTRPQPPPSSSIETPAYGTSRNDSEPTGALEMYTLNSGGSK